MTVANSNWSDLTSTKFRVVQCKYKLSVNIVISDSRDRIVVSTLRCGRSNPGSNPGHGSTKVLTWHERNLFLLWKKHSLGFIVTSSDFDFIMEKICERNGSWNSKFDRRTFGALLRAALFDKPKRRRSKRRHLWRGKNFLRDLLNNAKIRPIHLVARQI